MGIKYEGDSGEDILGDVADNAVEHGIKFRQVCVATGEQTTYVNGAMIGGGFWDERALDRGRRVSARGRHLAQGPTTQDIRFD